MGRIFQEWTYQLKQERYGWEIRWPTLIDLISHSIDTAYNRQYGESMSFESVAKNLYASPGGHHSLNWPQAQSTSQMYWPTMWYSLGNTQQVRQAMNSSVQSKQTAHIACYNQVRWSSLALEQGCNRCRTVCGGLGNGFCEYNGLTACTKWAERLGMKNNRLNYKRTDPVWNVVKLP